MNTVCPGFFGALCLKVFSQLFNIIMETLLSVLSE